MSELSEISGALGKIIVADLVLSGDNALVIGLAVQQLPPTLKKRAILWGTVGAVVLRVIFTITAAFFLKVPLLKALGGLALLWIGWKLVAQNDDSPHTDLQAKNNFADAVRTIVIADAVMSLDNALAVAGAAGESLTLLLIGLGLSIPLLMVGSNVIANVMQRYPWLVYVGAAVIAYVGAELIHGDKLLQQWIPGFEQAWVLWIMVAASVAGVLYFGKKSQSNDDTLEKTQHG